MEYTADNIYSNVILDIWKYNNKEKCIRKTEKKILDDNREIKITEDELDELATAEEFSVVQKEGTRNVTRRVKCYNLDAIIAVRYRVNSKKATRFRQWVTKTLKEYIIKGFVLNDEMLKNGKPFGKDYFDELLEKSGK